MKIKNILTLALSISLLTACTNYNDTATNQKNKIEENESVKPAEENRPAADNTKNSEEIATVNDTSFSRNEYLKEAQFYAMLAQTKQDFKNYVLDLMLENQLILDDLKKNNIELTDADIDKVYKEYIDINGGQDEYNKMLNDYGLTEDDFKELAKKEAAFRAHVAMFNKKNPVDETQMKEYFEENKDNLIKADVSHILVETEDEAKEIKSKLDNGEDFRELAKQNSIDEYSKDQGGDLGESYLYEFDNDFKNAVLELNDGDISEVVKTSFGYHIIKINKIEKDFENYKDEIEKLLNNEKYYEYLDDLRINSTITVEGEKDPFLDENTEQNDDTLENTSSDETESEENTSENTDNE